MMRLVFGMGATKSGSGWLFRFLQSHPECHLRDLKELHFFDTIEFGKTRARLRKIRRNMAMLQERPAGDLDAERRLRDLADWLPVAQREDRADYLRYLAEGRGTRSVIADITPAYAMVSAATLREMLNLLPDTRFVFFMRDPVARLWSHVRMLARRAVRSGADAAQAAAHHLDLVLSGRDPLVADRGAYDVILPRLQSVLPAERLHVDFFEDIVPPGRTDRLCAFLGIAAHPSDVKRPHQGIDLPLADDQRARIRAYLAPQYEFVRSRMGRLPAAWEDSFAKG
jgi:hypothetical protein